MATISSFLAMFCGLVISIMGLRLDLFTYVGSFQFTTPCRSIQNCQTPNLVLGLGVDFTFPYNNKNNKNKKNPHLIFHRREGTRGLKFGKQT